jgi:hypothetical protein
MGDEETRARILDSLAQYRAGKLSIADLSIWAARYQSKVTVRILPALVS